MLRFSANLSMLFQEYDFLDRFRKRRPVVFALLNLCFPTTMRLSY